MTFFLNAAREAAIPISPYIMKNKKPRSGPTKRRAPKQPAARGSAAGSATHDPAIPPTVMQAKPMEYQLLDLLSAEMTEAEKQAVWTLISYLKQQ
jgi:hypothetical protein